MKCPESVTSPVFVQNEEHHWQTTRWSNSSNGGSSRFPGGFPQPRTCSYCGGVNIEDALTLLSLGWEVEATTKQYKRYLHPPGYMRSSELFLRHLSKHPFDRDNAPPVVESPVPPVKLYSWHIESDEQLDRLNKAIRANFAKQSDEAAEEARGT